MEDFFGKLKKKKRLTKEKRPFEKERRKVKVARVETDRVVCFVKSRFT